MLIGEIAARDRVSVGIDDETGQVWIARTKFGHAEDDLEATDIVHIDREDLPTVIKHLQDALNHDA